MLKYSVVSCPSSLLLNALNAEIHCHASQFWSLYHHWHFWKRCPVCAGKMALPVLWQFFDRFPTAEVTRRSDWKVLADLLQPLGLNTLRAKALIRFSGESMHLEPNLKSNVLRSVMYSKHESDQLSFQCFTDLNGTQHNSKLALCWAPNYNSKR